MAHGNDTLDEVLAHVVPTLSAALVGDDGRAALAACCRRLPIQVAAFWGLECALASPPAMADLLVEIKRDSSAHARLTGATPSAFDALCDQASPWAALRRFARAWADEGEARRTAIRNVWVEFDLIAAARAHPGTDALLQPSVFWGPEDVGRGGWEPLSRAVTLAAETFDPFPRQLPEAALRKATDHLPEGARIFQLGAMQARGNVVLRMCVNRVSPEDVPGWLAKQQWPGDAAALARTLDALAPMVRTVAIDLDYTRDGLGPKIGIECYQNWRELSPRQWQPLLQHLEELGLCLADRRSGVAAFPASTEFLLRDQVERKSDGMVFPVVYRNLHHIKVSFAADRAVDAKAYLGVTRPGVRLGLATLDGPDTGAEGWLGS